MALPERNVLVPAIVLLFVGASSLVTFAFGIFEDSLLLDPSILAFPIGYGLLRGNENSRFLARLGAALVLISALVGLIIIAVFAFRGQGLGEFAWIDALSTALWTLLCLLIFVWLRKQHVGDWFLESRSRRFARSCALGIALVAVAYTVDDHLRVREQRALLDDAFPVRVQIVPVDASTGRGISSALTLPDHGRASWRTYPYDLLDAFPKLTYGARTTAEGWEITAEGILVEPTEIRLELDGYREATVTLDRATEGSLRLPMKRQEIEPQDAPDAADGDADGESFPLAR